MVMEKSWNMKNLPKVISFCDQSWNFTNFVQILPNLHVFNFVSGKKFNINLESPHFAMFSAKCRECKIGKRDGHGKSRNGHGKVMENILSSMWEP